MDSRLKALRNSAEFAEEKLVTSVQSLLQEVLNQRGMSRSDLAKKMGVSKARISQMFSESQNFTLRLVALAFHALGEEVSITRPAQLEYKSMAGPDCETSLSFDQVTSEVTHGFEWLDQKIQIGLQPVTRQFEIGEETQQSINRTIKAVLKECLEDKRQDSRKEQDLSATDHWVNNDGNVVVPFARKKVS